MAPCWTYDEIIEIRKRFFKNGTQSADVFDALDVLGLPDQCADLAIRPFREDMIIAGPAFTYFGTKEPRYDEDLIVPELDNFAAFEKLYPGCIIVMNANSDGVVGHFGEFMSWNARNRGAAGCVIDGGCRDRRNVNMIPDWGMFARYSSPVESKTRWRPKEIEQPIFITGATKKFLRVNPGDWIFADLDSVLVIPKDAVLDVVAKVEQISEVEFKIRNALREGGDYKELSNKYGREGKDMLAGNKAL